MNQRRIRPGMKSVAGRAAVGFVAALFLGGALSACMVELPAEEDGSPSSSSSAAGEDSGADKADDTEEKAPASQVEQFKDFVAKNGSATEQKVVKHVTKVQGADTQNDIMDAAEVFTDYSGGMMGPHANDGKLIASAFADWKDSKNGLVTIYDKDGELLSNGNY